MIVFLNIKMGVFLQLMEFNIIKILNRLWLFNLNYINYNKTQVSVAYKSLCSLYILVINKILKYTLFQIFIYNFRLVYTVFFI